jgi:hypothetical protein
MEDVFLVRVYRDVWTTVTSVRGKTVCRLIWESLTHVPFLRAALPDQSAFSSNSLLSAGAGRNVSTTFSTFASSLRARCTLARTILLNVSHETANALVATPSSSPFSETTRAGVWYACANAASP